jgi:hypothetical protein
MSGVNSSKFINLYENNVQYVADASERAALGKSTVSLEDDTGKLHYDGVNVVVSRPKQGDAVYVPTTSVYSAATPGSGVTEGSVTFVAGDTVDNAKMTSAGFTALGVVASVRGNKCYVLYKTVGAAGPFFTDATSSSYAIPSDKLSDDDLAKITAGDAKDTQGLVGFRATCSVDVLFARLTGSGGASKNEGWNGGASGLQNDFLNGADWGLALGPAASSVTAHDATTYKVAETIAKFGTGEAGFRKYLESRRLAYPCSLASNSVVFQDGKAATNVLVDANEADNSAFFRVAQFAYNHNLTWGSYGQFANVDGLRRGDWFQPGLGIMQDVFRHVKYTLESPAADVFNKTLSKIGGSTLQLNTNSNDSRYWLPFVRSRSYGWLLDNPGFFLGNRSLDNSYRALSVALLDI